MLNRRKVLTSAAALALTLTTGLAQAAWPERPITMLVPWGAGGGTDAVARIVASLMEKDLGKPVNVVNRTGGNGAVAHQAAIAAKPDGYTIILSSPEITTLHHQGLANVSYKDYVPLAMVNDDPASLAVSIDSPYKNFNDLMTAIKANPGKLKASGVGRGGIWHLSLSGMLDSFQLPAESVAWVPSAGAAPAYVDLAAGGIDIVAASLPEGRSLIDSGRARALVVMADQPSELYPNVPTLKSLTGNTWESSAWRGLFAPKGLPDDLRDKYSALFKKISESQEYRDFMKTRGFGIRFMDSADFSKFVAQNDQDMGKVLKAVGMAK
jgi:tripartite-type tricarboxylate transporter receptor subunit TctC